MLEIVEVSMPIANLPRAFEGYRILQISDPHHSNIVPLSIIRNAVDAARDLSFDLFALTGDFVTNEKVQPGAGAKYAEPCLVELSKLRAPDGLYAVLGNHDNQAGRETVQRACENTDIELLIDRGRRLERGSESIWLAGVDDLWTAPDRSAGLDRSLEGRRENEPAIVLAHNPDQIEEFVARDVGGAITGHTHGGQISLPFIGPPFVPSRYGQKYAYGLFRENRTSMWVSRGLGTMLLPARMMNRSEIVLITLDRAL